MSSSIPQIISPNVKTRIAAWKALSLGMSPTNAESNEYYSKSILHLFDPMLIALKYGFAFINNSEEFDACINSTRSFFYIVSARLKHHIKEHKKLLATVQRKKRDLSTAVVSDLEYLISKHANDAKEACKFLNLSFSHILDTLCLLNPSQRRTLALCVSLTNIVSSCYNICKWSINTCKNDTLAAGVCHTLLFSVISSYHTLETILMRQGSGSLGESQRLVDQLSFCLMNCAFCMNIARGIYIMQDIPVIPSSSSFSSKNFGTTTLNAPFGHFSVDPHPLFTPLSSLSIPLFSPIHFPTSSIQRHRCTTIALCVCVRIIGCVGVSNTSSVLSELSVKGLEHFKECLTCEKESSDLKVQFDHIYDDILKYYIHLCNSNCDLSQDMSTICRKGCDGARLDKSSSVYTLVSSLLQFSFPSDISKTYPSHASSSSCVLPSSSAALSVFIWCDALRIMFSTLQSDYAPIETDGERAERRRIFEMGSRRVCSDIGILLGEQERRVKEYKAILMVKEKLDIGHDDALKEANILMQRPKDARMSSFVPYSFHLSAYLSSLSQLFVKYATVVPSSYVYHARNTDGIVDNTFAQTDAKISETDTDTDAVDDDEEGEEGKSDFVPFSPLLSLQLCVGCIFGLWSEGMIEKDMSLARNQKKGKGQGGKRRALAKIIHPSCSSLFHDLFTDSDIFSIYSCLITQNTDSESKEEGEKGEEEKVEANKFKIEDQTLSLSPNLLCEPLLSSLFSYSLSFILIPTFELLSSISLPLLRSSSSLLSSSFSLFISLSQSSCSLSARFSALTTCVREWLFTRIGCDFIAKGRKGGGLASITGMMIDIGHVFAKTSASLSEKEKKERKERTRIQNEQMRKENEAKKRILERKKNKISAAEMIEIDTDDLDSVGKRRWKEKEEEDAVERKKEKKEKKEKEEEMEEERKRNSAPL
ncbi:hypothetical protein ADUPG1_007179, partial [Aduncisulcus paluster]